MRASSVPVRTSSVQHNAVAIYDAWDLPPLVNNFVPNGGSLADYFFCIEQKRGALLTVADKRATIEALARSHVQAFLTSMPQNERAAVTAALAKELLHIQNAQLSRATLWSNFLEAKVDEYLGIMPRDEHPKASSGERPAAVIRI